MLELFPEGFEELVRDDGVELAAYTNGAGEERVRDVFGRATGIDVPQDWSERWRQFHRPVRVGPLWIGPPWDEPPPDTQAVVIEPGRAFGTGGHPTTRLCIEHLLGLPRGSVLDVGCGSGVVGLAAGRLGFAPVVAVDEDPQAVAAAEANARANDLPLEVVLADALAGGLPAADVAVANIERRAVERLAPLLQAPVFITSGYLTSEVPAPSGYRRVARRELDGWAADTFAAA